MELQEAKDAVLQLMKDKENIESNLRALKEILDSVCIAYYFTPYRACAKRMTLLSRNTKVDVQHDLSIFKDFLYFQYNKLQNHVGMDEPLVDSEGFPRQDIDVYQVRHARHKIICA